MSEITRAGWLIVQNTDSIAYQLITSSPGGVLVQEVGTYDAGVLTRAAIQPPMYETWNWARNSSRQWRLIAQRQAFDLRRLAPGETIELEDLLERHGG